MSLFRRYAIPQSELTPSAPAGYWINYAGVVTSLELFPHSSGLSGSFVDRDPLPDDGVYGTATEHLAVIEALYRAENRE